MIVRLHMKAHCECFSLTSASIDTCSRSGAFASEYLTLRSTYFGGRPPKSVNMYWRRFALSEIPLDNADDFEVWLNARWREKDQLLELWNQTSRFPADKSAIAAGTQDNSGYINTEVKLSSWLEIGQIFVVLAAVAVVLDVIRKFFVIFASVVGS